MAIELSVNTNEAREYGNLLAVVRGLKDTGKKKVRITEDRPGRSNPANRYYYGCVVVALQEFLLSQGESLTNDQCHSILKRKNLAHLVRQIHNPETGELVDEVLPSITGLNDKEFGEYIERCIVWLEEFFGVEVPPPDSQHIRPQGARTGGQ